MISHYKRSYLALSLLELTSDQIIIIIIELPMAIIFIFIIIIIIIIIKEFTIKAIFAKQIALVFKCFIKYFINLLVFIFIIFIL